MTDLLSSYLGSHSGGSGGSSNSLLSSYVGASPSPHHSAAYAAALRQSAGGGGNPAESVFGHSGGITGWLHNFATGIENTITQIPAATEHVGQAAYYSLWEHPNRSLSQDWNDPRALGGGVFRPQVQDVAHRVHDPHYALYDDPFGTALLVGSLFSFGGSGALKFAKTGVRTGRIAETSRLGRLADDLGRTAKVGDFQIVRPRAGTLQGRMAEDFIDSIGTRHPDWRIIGESRIALQRAKQSDMRLRDSQMRIARQAAEVDGHLAPWERVAVYVAAQPTVRLDERIAYYRTQMAKHPEDPLPYKRILSQLEDPRVADALKNPTPRMLLSAHLHHRADQFEADIAQKIGRLTPDVHERRRYLEARLVGGAERGDSPQLIRFKESQAAVSKARANIRRLRRELTTTGKRATNTANLNPLPESRVRAALSKSPGIAGGAPYVRLVDGTVKRVGNHIISSTGDLQLADGTLVDLKVINAVLDRNKAIIDEMRPTRRVTSRAGARTADVIRAELKDAQRQLADARKNRVREPTGNDRYALVGGPEIPDIQAAEQAWKDGQLDTGISPLFPGAFRVEHGILADSKDARFFSRNSVKTGKVQVGGHFKFNAGLQFEAAKLSMDASINLVSMAKTLQEAHYLDWQNILDQVAIEPTPEIFYNAREMAKYEPYRPSRETRATSPTIGRDVSEMRQMVANDIRNATPDEGYTQALESRLNEILPGTKEFKTLEDLKEQGLLLIPREWGNAARADFKSTSKVARLWIDRPMDVWRFFQLGLVPRWSVTNAVGNAMMYVAGMNRNGPAAFLTALKDSARLPESTARAFRRSLEQNKAAPAWRRKMLADVLDEVVPGLHQSSFYNTQARVTHAGVFSEQWQASKLAQIARGEKAPLVSLTGKAPFKIVRALGRANIHFNQALDNMMRDAAFLQIAGKDIERWQVTQRKIGAANTSLEDALRAIYKDAPDGREKAILALDRVNDMLGDFNNMSEFERGVIRRFFAPFYSWFKVINTVAVKTLFNHPLRVTFLNQMARLTSQQGSADLPSWLRWSIRIPWFGGEAYVSTQNLNPFNTVNQIGQIVAGLFAYKQHKGEYVPSSGASNVFGVLNPFVGAAYAGITHQDPFTGGAIHGPGSSRGPVQAAGGQILMGLPEVSYGQKILGGKAVPGTDIKPVHQAYPSQLYHNTWYDDLLNFFGLPVKRVDKQRARELAQEGQ